MIATCTEMKAMEERLLATGVEAEALMEVAGARMAAAVREFFPEPGTCLAVFGKGHNGGDALVAARYLAQAGWKIRLDPVFSRETLAPLTRKQWEALEGFRLEGEDAGRVLVSSPLDSDWDRPLVILDGLLGIGASFGLREPIRSAARRINRLRLEAGATVFALDLPTGLDGDSGAADPDAVVADFTLAVGLAKRGLVADGALDFVGRLAVLPLPGLTDLDSGESVATPESLAGVFPPRRYGMHKGNCGRVGILAGSRGLTGAAVMAANAAVRAGAGLVSLFVQPEIYSIVASAAMPEVMVAPVDCYLDVLDRPLDVLAVGPGLGREEGEDLLAVMEFFKGPMVVDADALNVLATRLDLLRRVAGPRLLTPHPGEMLRLFPEAASLTRRETVERFLAPLAEAGVAVTLLLKGSRTLVGELGAAGGGRFSYNSTGNPGMASGGMGDVLTGTCAALAGQGLGLFDAARAGAWLCGRAAELAVSRGGRSHQSLCATDLPEFFGRAFRELR